MLQCKIGHYEESGPNCIRSPKEFGEGRKYNLNSRSYKFKVKDTGWDRPRGWGLSPWAGCSTRVSEARWSSGPCPLAPWLHTRNNSWKWANNRGLSPRHRATHTHVLYTEPLNFHMALFSPSLPQLIPTSPKISQRKIQRRSLMWPHSLNKRPNRFCSLSNMDAENINKPFPILK